MKMNTFSIGGTLAISLAIGACLSGCTQKDISFNTVEIRPDTVSAIVTATGYVQPVDKVDVGTQVSGVIEKLYVDFNSHVKKGELLAELDKSTLAEKVTQANASLMSALSDNTFSQQNYDRTKKLYDSNAATQASWEQAVNTLDQSKTNVANARANLHQARANLAYAEIYSPIDGVVLNRAVDQGQTVAASFNTPTLFTIAKDLTKMQVEANVDEADIGQIQVGQTVSFTVDSYTDDTFAGTVNQIRLQPTVTNNVVTYTVIIEAPNPEQKLFPGMTANVSITTRSESGLAVTAEALGYKPSGAVQAKYNVKLPEGRAKGVWVQTASSIEFRPLKLGLSDGIRTIVESGLQSGDKVVLSVVDAQKDKSPQAAANPLIPQRPKKN